MSVVMPLPARLDNAAAGALRSSLLEVRGKPLDLDASGVEKLGTLCIQVLLSARKTWASDGHPIAVTNWPDSIAEKLTSIGLSPTDFAKEVV